MITSVGSNARIDRAVLLLNIRQLLTLRSAVDGPRRGASLSELGIIEDAAVLCLGGKIVSVGTTKDALRDPWLKKNRKKVTEIDCARARGLTRLRRFPYSPGIHASAAGGF